MVPGSALWPDPEARGQGQGQAVAQVPFLGVLTEKKLRPAGLSGPGQLEPTPGQTLGTPPPWAPQLGQLPPALPGKVVAEAGTETRLHA